MTGSDASIGRGVRGLLVAALCIPLVVAAAALAPSITHADDPAWTFYAESHVDDPIGAGRTFFAESGGSEEFRADPFGRNWVDISCCGIRHSWAHRLRLPSDSPLVAGETYEGSVEVLGPIGGYGGSCSAAEASVSAFHVHDVDYDSAGDLSLLSMSVRQRCGAGDYRAEVRFNTSSPPFAAVLPSVNPYFSFGALDLPPTAIGSMSAPTTIELTSVGALPVEIGATSISGVDETDFQISDNDCSGRQIATGQTCTFALRFAPTARGGRRARASIGFDTPAGGKQWLIGGYGQIATTTTIDAPTAPVLGAVHIAGRVQPVPDDWSGACTLHLRRANETMGGTAYACDETGRVTFETSLSVGRHRLHVAFDGTPDFAASRSPDVTIDVIRQQDWATASVSPTRFYPVVDQYQDRLSVEGSRKQPVAVDIAIRSVMTDEIVHEGSIPAGIGDYVWQWDGTGGLAATPLVDPGEYDVVVTLSDDVPNVRVSTKRITLSHDFVTWSDRKKVKVLDGRDFSLWGWSKDARISTSKSAYPRGGRLISNKGFAGVIHVFPVDTRKIIGPMSFEVYGRSPNRHRAIVAVWNPALGSYKRFDNYDAVKLVGPRQRWWKVGVAGEGRVKDGKARVTVAVWKGLGGRGSSVFDIKSVRLAYTVGTLHAAQGASISAVPRSEPPIEATGRRVGSMTALDLPELRPAPAKPGPVTEPEEEMAPRPQVVPDEPADADGIPDESVDAETAEPTASPEPNRPPLADAGGPYALHEGGMVRLDAMGSSDPDGKIATYAWDHGERLGDPFSPTPAFSAADDCELGITLTVTDDDGATDTDSARITVVNVAPELEPIGPYAATVDEPIVLRDLVITDPGVLDSHTLRVAWGDGQASEGWMTDEGVPRAKHTYDAPGMYTVEVTVSDDDGGERSRKAEVRVLAQLDEVPTSPRPESTIVDAEAPSHPGTGVS